MNCFQRLERALVDAGFVEDARWIREPLSLPWTTSGEMLGEFGLAIKRIYKAIPIDARTALRDLFGECEQAVQRAWPEFTLDS